MNYIDGILDAPYDTDESIAEQVSTHQQSLDTLYWIGCQYGISNEGMKALCKMANVSWEELKKHSGESATR